MNRKYSPEMRERVLRMLAETRPSHTLDDERGPACRWSAADGSGDVAVVAAPLRGRRRGEAGLATDAAAEIKWLHAENCGVYGLRKVHALMRRQGWEIDRDQTEPQQQCGISSGSISWPS